MSLAIDRSLSTPLFLLRAGASQRLIGDDSCYGFNRILMIHWNRLGPCWIRVITRDPVPFGPSAHFTPGPIWAPGPYVPRAHHMGPAPLQALDPFGPWARSGSWGMLALESWIPCGPLSPLGLWVHMGPAPTWSLAHTDTPPKA